MRNAWDNFVFLFMVLVFWFRDLIRPPGKVLGELAIEPGSCVLDYGCGTGVFSFASADLVGESGRVYAVDSLPMAVARVRRIAAKKQLANIEAIRTDCTTPLADESIDLVLLYDTFHLLADPRAVLAELNRLLKTTGVMSFSDHHMKEERILAEVTAGGRFELVAKGQHSHVFAKA